MAGSYRAWPAPFLATCPLCTRRTLRPYYKQVPLLPDGRRIGPDLAPSDVACCGTCLRQNGWGYLERAYHGHWSPFWATGKWAAGTTHAAPGLKLAWWLVVPVVSGLAAFVAMGLLFMAALDAFPIQPR